MKRILLSAALFVFPCVIGAASAQEIIKIRDDQVQNVDLSSKLQGRWKLVGMQKDGKRVAEADLRGQQVLFRENRIVLTRPNGDAEVFHFKVNATKTPAQIDLTILDHDDKVRTFPGIIEQEGDTVRLGACEESCVKNAGWV
jgi:uncharacterized protein (TIGR03067 family)